MPARASRSPGCASAIVAQGRVVEDHVGRNVLLARRFRRARRAAIRSVPAPRREVSIDVACPRAHRVAPPRRAGGSARSDKRPFALSNAAAGRRSGATRHGLRHRAPAGPPRPAGGTRCATASHRGRRRCRRCSAFHGRTAAPSRCPRRAARRSGARRRSAGRCGTRTTALSARRRCRPSSAAGRLAVVAMAAGARMRFAEIRQQRLPAAAGGFAVADQRIELAAFQPLALRAGLGVGDHAAAASPHRPGRSAARLPPARRRGRRGRFPGNSLPAISAGRGARRSARRACRCPCRTRSSPP